MQSAGLDQAEVGDQRALHLQILDAANEVGQRWVEFLDDRRARPWSVWVTMTFTSSRSSAPPRRMTAIGSAAASCGRGE